MNKLRLLLLGALATVSPAFAQATASASSDVKTYVQPSAVLALQGNFDAAAGAALAVGVTLNQTHSLQVEAIRFKSKDGWIEVTFTPILGRLQIPPGDRPRFCCQRRRDGGRYEREEQRLLA